MISIPLTNRTRICINCNPETIFTEGWTCPHCGEPGLSYFLKPWLDKPIEQIRTLPRKDGAPNG